MKKFLFDLENHIYTDNLYNSFNDIFNLLDIGVYFTGTLRQGRVRDDGSKKNARFIKK